MSQVGFDIQGHRGARGLMPENTVVAFKKALDLGVKTLELDVVISKDGKVVVSHDPFFHPDISTDPAGNPVTKETKSNTYLLTYKEIKMYDVGLRGNKNFPEQQKIKAYKPLLSEVIKETKKYAKRKGLPPPHYNIELKSLREEYNKSQPEAPLFCDLVHDVIFKKLDAEQVTIQSFDFNLLRYWHSRIQSLEYQNVKLSALIEPTDNNDIDYNLDLLGFKPQIWSPYFLQLSPERIQYLHSMGIKVIPWTVNDPKQMKRMKEIGCDGLITDYPDRAKNL